MADKADFPDDQSGKTEVEQKPIGPITKHENAVSYLAEFKIPEMLSGLIAGLMVERPHDHYQYLDTKLEEIKLRGMENIDWDSFIYHLHPSRDKLHKQFIQDPNSVQDKRGLPHFIDEEYEPQVFSLTEPKD